MAVWSVLEEFVQSVVLMDNPAQQARKHTEVGVTHTHTHTHYKTWNLETGPSFGLGSGLLRNTFPDYVIGGVRVQHPTTV